MNDLRFQAFNRRWIVPAMISALAWFAVVLTIDPTGVYPRTAAGPGLTIDESFNIEQGVLLAEAIRAYNIGLLHPDSVEEFFGMPAYLPDHPPLGRLALGFVHDLVAWLVPPQTDYPFGIAACARIASATAFALTVFLIGYTTSNWYGRRAGCVAAIALVLMPRVFGHAHLAALESFMSLTYAATVLSVVSAWGRRPAKGVRYALWTGLIFGLALLTKIQAILLPVPIIVWALIHWRLKAIVPLCVWGTTAFAVFFIGWPWLWIDPVTHLTEYFGRTTGRVEIQAWYMGRQFADRDVPWHYAFVMFLVTVPLGLQILGMLGAGTRNSTGEQQHVLRRRELLLLACLVFPLVVFSLPNVAVYDGVRLFLVVFPLWAIFIGKGAQIAFQWALSRWSRSAVRSGFAVFLAAQAYGVLALQPCYLSYYNLAVGGLRGATALGFEPTYWGDSFTQTFFRDVVSAVPAGSTIEVVPVLHASQLPILIIQSPILQQQEIQLQAFDGSVESLAPTRYVMAFMHKAYLPAQLPPQGVHSRVLATLTREGVPLATLYQWSKSAKPAE